MLLQMARRFELNSANRTSEGFIAVNFTMQIQIARRFEAISANFAFEGSFDAVNKLLMHLPTAGFSEGS